MFISRQDFFGKLNAINRINVTGVGKYYLINYPRCFYIYEDERRLAKYSKEPGSRIWRSEVATGLSDADALAIFEGTKLRKKLEKDFQDLQKMIQEHNKKERVQK